MQSIAYLKASDGSGNASVATVQTARSGGASTIEVNTVQGIPAKFAGSMGTPHTFIDPVTSEEITVISEDTAVDFFGHVDGSDLEIDQIAPGYTDNGSDVGDIIIIRPITEYANNLANILGAAHQDDGKLLTTSLDEFYKPSELTPNNFVASGGVIALVSLLTASFSNIVYYMSGLRRTKTGVANRAYIANRDTYVDIDSTGTLYYTEVANGATTGFTLAAGRMRLAKVVTNGSTITSITQSGYDVLNNRIYNRYPLTVEQTPFFFEEIGRTKLLAGVTNFSVNFPPRNFLKVMVFTVAQTAVLRQLMRYNNDSTNSYSDTYSQPDSAGPVRGHDTGQNAHYMDINNLSPGDRYNGHIEITNKVGQPKLSFINGYYTAYSPSAWQVPGLFYNQWAKNEQATSIQINTIAGGTFASESEIVVLGRD
ncbi:MAG TPA: hypothetical protein VD907_06995 [Verrucomicrobiae bacterium]|nr:hypothetical protein [Verrucomicrobiae bacterium]